jgi:mono/diheme cytochrome c family protein
MTRHALAAAVATFTLLLPGAAAAQNAKAEQGAALFTSQKCTLCHSVAGKGNPKGSLDGIGSARKADEIRQWILDPDAMRAKAKATRTPAMKKMTLTPEQVDALVAYLESLKGARPGGDGAR